jgi:glycosyltransferase involved in cell wall biosynthesis
MGADAIVANSNFLAHELRNRFPTYNSKISTIYNGIDYDFIESGKANVSVWRSGTIRILSVVTATYEKKTEGVHLLLEAFEIMCQTRNDLSLFIAAGTSRPNISETMCEAVDRLNCSNKVRLEFNRQDVPDLLAAANLFLYATPPDSSDSLPRALLEAQAVGVPIVTTATTGCGEVVIDGESGRAVSYTPESIAEAALELIEQRNSAAIMADNGRQLVRARFNWEIMADAYEKIFLMATSAKHDSRKLEDENEDL